MRGCRGRSQAQISHGHQTGAYRGPSNGCWAWRVAAIESGQQASDGQQADTLRGEDVEGCLPSQALDDMYACFAGIGAAQT
eukprot:1160414-Pelagomonas_calceolata.AAC.5